MKALLAKRSATAALFDRKAAAYRDMGYLDGDGYIYLVGRKDTHHCGWRKYCPAEIRRSACHPALMRLPLLVYLRGKGPKIAAFVAVRPGQTVTENELGDFCKARLSSFKKPEDIHFMDELPKNHMGKVLKKELRSQYGE